MTNLPVQPLSAEMARDIISMSGVVPKERPFFMRKEWDAIADDLRAAADDIIDRAQTDWGHAQAAYKGYPKKLRRFKSEYDDSMALATRLRAHADTIERVEKEMREHADDWRHKWKQAIEWANDLRGDKS